MIVDMLVIPLLVSILKSEIEWLSHIQDIAAECHFYDNSIITNK